MENYLVSARKYRPLEFDSVVGQKHITETLENAIDNNLLPQALLFCGPRGVGKTTCARILARKINEKDGLEDVDGFAFNIFELDAASNNSVDGMRDLIDQVRYAPQIGKYKVYIIDEVHMLSNQAFNAFLKTLEEPPEHAVFILATTEKHKVLPTILSRCQIFEFKKIQTQDILLHLKEIAAKENILYEEEALYLIAQKADGGLRDALSSFDRISTFCNKNITLEKTAENLQVVDYEFYLQLSSKMIANDIPDVLRSFSVILDKGFDAHLFVAGLGGHFRDLMVAKSPQTIELLEVDENTKKKYQEQSLQWEPKQLVDAIQICNDADIHYERSKNRRLTVEIALMQLTSLHLNEGDIKKKSLES